MKKKTTADVLQGVINSVTARGKRYNYHRSTGLKLPDGDPKSQVVQDAARQIEHSLSVGSDVINRWGIKPEDLDRDALTTTFNPDLLALTMFGAMQFVLIAKENDLAMYHSGDLASDIARDPLLRDRQQYFLLCADLGLINLRQQRRRPGWAHYFARRTDMPLREAPQHVVYGDISPADYRSLVAVDERQSHQSVARAIRDALGCTELQCYEVRDDLIRRGWVTTGPGPHLTELGEKMLG